MSMIRFKIVALKNENQAKPSDQFFKLKRGDILLRNFKQDPYNSMSNILLNSWTFLLTFFIPDGYHHAALYKGMGLVLEVDANLPRIIVEQTLEESLDRYKPIKNQPAKYNIARITDDENTINAAIHYLEITKEMGIRYNRWGIGNVVNWDALGRPIYDSLNCVSSIYVAFMHANFEFYKPVIDNSLTPLERWAVKKFFTGYIFKANAQLSVTLTKEEILKLSKKE